MSHPVPHKARRATARRPYTLSDMKPELEQWIKEESLRRQALTLPRPALYEVVQDAVELLRAQTKPSRGHVYYLTDGRGPYLSTHECLDALGVPQEDRGQYWHRHDRLPTEFADQIEVRPATDPVATTQPQPALT